MRRDREKHQISTATHMRLRSSSISLVVAGSPSTRQEELVPDYWCILSNIPVLGVGQFLQKFSDDYRSTSTTA
ncbi:hypothetical protein J6590_004790 [Homalodisca vitripennis]|nr:hypothetical protein J6590_004790 [Homalodisca vitripennis]